MEDVRAWNFVHAEPLPWQGSHDGEMADSSDSMLENVARRARGSQPRRRARGSDPSLARVRQGEARARQGEATMRQGGGNGETAMYVPISVAIFVQDNLDRLSAVSALAASARLVIAQSA